MSNFKPFVYLFYYDFNLRLHRGIGMRRKFSLPLLVVCFVFGLVGLTNATTINFTASNFTKDIPTAVPRPISTITGSIGYTYDGASAFTLIAFDMTVKNKTYGLSDLEYGSADFAGSPPDVRIGPIEPDGVGGGSASGQDDFNFTLVLDTPGISAFRYTTKEDFGVWKAGNIVVATVPEPTTVAQLGIGLVGLAGAEVRRRRKKKAVDNS